MFIEQTLDARIEAALPTLAKIQQRGRAMKEAQIFENWANQIMEGTWALPDTPEAQKKLDNLMSSELIVGPDATNATEQLYDVIGDDELFDILSDLAQRDPRANIWDDSDVQARLAELGIQTPQSTEVEPADVAQDTAPGQQGVAEAAKWRDTKYKDRLYTQEPGDSDDYDNIGYGYDFPERPENDPGQKRRMGGVGSEFDSNDPLVKGQGIGRSGIKHSLNLAGKRKGLPSRDQITSLKGSIKDAHGKHRKPNLPEQGVEEDLDAMLRHAGVPVKESVLTDSTGHTLDHILQRFSREVSDFKQTGELDRDLFEALYDYYFDDMPYGIKKARTGDPDEWIGDRLAAELGMNEADNISTFEVMSGFDAPVAEGSCNMTTEGEYCPEHGLAECGMSEQNVPIPSSSTAAIVKGSTQAASQGIGATRPNTANMPLSEKEDDPINRNAAITGSYYESDALARMKKLALGK
jgi:hypothetical protein